MTATAVVRTARESAKLARTTAQEWVTRVLLEAVERAADRERRAAARLADRIRGRWRDTLSLDAYTQEVAATADADLANL